MTRCDPDTEMGYFVTLSEMWRMTWRAPIHCGPTGGAHHGDGGAERVHAECAAGGERLGRRDGLVVGPRAASQDVI